MLLNQTGIGLGAGGASLFSSINIGFAGAFAIEAEEASMLEKTIFTISDDAAFWSGTYGANRVQAELSGLTTLEQTPTGRALDAEDLFSKLPYDKAIVPWENLSQQFASEASGTVNAWVGGATPESVWTRIEKPALMLNQNVHRIIIRDSMKPWKIKIIYK